MKAFLSIKNSIFEQRATVSTIKCIYRLGGISGTICPNITRVYKYMGILKKHLRRYENPYIGSQLQLDIFINRYVLMVSNTLTLLPLLLYRLTTTTYT